MATIVFVFTISSAYNQSAYASLITKPMTITAKKVAKELAQESAVAMAEHILFEKAMKEFLETDLDKVDEGFKPVCLDGSMSYKDCPPDKRAQIKENISGADKNKLSSTVENIIEKKTNTSGKWAKFLDWFIPIFLISGVVATFDAMLDSDSEGLIDDIANEALVSSGLLKGLGGGSPESENIPEYNFEGIVQSLTTQVTSSPMVIIKLVIAPNKVLNMSVGKNNYALKGSTSVGLYYSGGYGVGDDKELSYPYVHLNSVIANGGHDDSAKKIIYKGKTGYTSHIDAGDMSKDYLESAIVGQFRIPMTINDTMNRFLGASNMGAVAVSFSVPVITPVEVVPDLGKQVGVEHIKKADGTVTTPGIDSFKYTYNNTYIYPAPDSETGWKEKGTGENIVVVEDDILVDSELDLPVKEDEKEEEFPSCKKDLKKINFKKVGNAFTNAFPFSIPWDIKRFIDASFGGVGGQKPSFTLPDSLGGAKIEIHPYFDGWIGFGRTLIVVMFDIALLYVFARFMRGGGD